MYKRILVPLDGSALSESILPHAQFLAKALNAEIVLLHVIVSPADEFVESIKTPLAPKADSEAKIEKEMTSYIKGICAKLEKEDVRATYLIREGSVIERILEDAEIMHVDMIAMSTHGRTGLLHLLLGSVAEKVVQHSPRLVALIRPRAE